MCLARGTALSWAEILIPVKAYFTKGYLLFGCPSGFLGSLFSKGLFVGIAFLLTWSFISKACDLAERLGLSFVVLLSLLTDLDFLSSFFYGILGSILRLTALTRLTALS